MKKIQVYVFQEMAAFICLLLYLCPPVTRKRRSRYILDVSAPA